MIFFSSIQLFKRLLNKVVNNFQQQQSNVISRYFCGGSLSLFGFENRFDDTGKPFIWLNSIIIDRIIQF